MFGNDWDRVLECEIKKPYFKLLLKKIDALYEKTHVLPEKEKLFRALKETPFAKVKVIILGQDPYPNPMDATGLSFASNNSCPRSLKNIYKELGKTVDIFSWPEKGVLLLNTILTVEAYKPLSHKDLGWQDFTDEIISLLSKRGGNVFLLFGKCASLKSALIDETKNKVIITSHPSPLSAKRGFLGSGCFKKCNKYLKENNLGEIEF